jgi:hypothetical protein
MIPTLTAPHPLIPSPLAGRAGWFHTSREKLKSSFKASPLNKGRGLERGKNLCFKRRNTDFHIFLFSYETTLLLACGEGT